MTSVRRQLSKAAFCCLTILLSYNAMATEISAVAIYSPEGAIIGYTRLLGNEGFSDCSPIIKSGFIASLDRGPNGVSVVGFALRASKSQHRDYVNLDFSHTSAIDTEKLVDLLEKGGSVTALVYQCGAGGRVVSADALQFSGVRK